MTEYSLYAFKLNRFTRLNWKENIKSLHKEARTKINYLCKISSKIS